MQLIRFKIDFIQSCKRARARTRTQIGRDTDRERGERKLRESDGERERSKQEERENNKRCKQRVKELEEIGEAARERNRVKTEETIKEINGGKRGKE